MRKVRKRRIESVREQIARHIGKIKDEPGRLDTTKDYWKKEIDEKFLKQLEEDESDGHDVKCLTFPASLSLLPRAA